MGTLDMVISGLWPPQVALHLLGLSSLICQMGRKQAPHDRERMATYGMWLCPAPRTRALCPHPIQGPREQPILLTRPCMDLPRARHPSTLQGLSVSATTIQAMGTQTLSGDPAEKPPLSFLFGSSLWAKGGLFLGVAGCPQRCNITMPFTKFT